VVNEILKLWFEKNIFKLLPGLGLVFVLVEYLYKVFQRGRPGPEGIWEILLFIFIVVVCLVLWYVGSWWDCLLYDPFFSVASPGSLKQLWEELLSPTPQTKRRKIISNLLRRLWRGLLTPLRCILGHLPPAEKLNATRKDAAEILNGKRAGQYDYEGLYKTAERLFSRTEEYEKKVEAPLEGSKLARSFLLPLLALTVYRFNFPHQAWPFEKSWLSVFWSWKVDLFVFGLFLAGYIYWRLLHMRRLFDFVANNRPNHRRDPENPGKVLVEMSMLEKELPYIY
jgi:hypothetical protein